MKMHNIFKIIYTLLFITISFPAYSRCAVCYTNGLSGASISVLVIISSLFSLFILNKLLKKYIEKN